MKIQSIVETAIYVDDLDRAEAFYRTILDFPMIVKEAGRHVFFHVGERNVLLAFCADSTLHGARGPGHVAFGIEADTLHTWRRKLQDNGILIEDEVAWPRGGKSIYFRDPAGNLLELVTPGIWGLPSGW
jgi:catechol 2,3-dioxygenase-like lactoylglutathione lyase family enzyme